MKVVLYIALAAYVVAAVHAILAFINKRAVLERMSLGALSFGFAAHTASLVIDWVEDGHYPLFHWSETLSFLAWTIVVAHLLAFYRYQARALSCFTLPLVALLTFIASVSGATPFSTAGTVTGGGGAWLFPVHTTLLLFAYASFFVVFAASVMYLLQERELKMKTFTPIFHRLPSLTTVDNISSTAAGIGWMLLTLGIVTGMVWSAVRGSRIWHNDPKEVFALLTWLLYLGLICYRHTGRWRGRRAAWLGVAGFELVICTFLGTRLMGGYHVFN